MATDTGEEVEYIYPVAKVVLVPFVSEEGYAEPFQGEDVAYKINHAILLQQLRTDQAFAEQVDKDYHLSVTMSQFIRGDISDDDLDKSDCILSRLITCEAAFKNRIQFELKQALGIVDIIKDGFIDATKEQTIDLVSQVIDGMEEFLQFIKNWHTVDTKKYCDEGMKVLQNITDKRDKAVSAADGPEFRKIFDENEIKLTHVHYLTDKRVKRDMKFIADEKKKAELEAFMRHTNFASEETKASNSGVASSGVESSGIDSDDEKPPAIAKEGYKSSSDDEFDELLKQSGED